MRSPRANLEALYGGGPLGSPYMYSLGDPSTLLENDGDLPRNQEGLALIGDPRNNVHAFMSQMQVAFIRAHYRLVDRLREDGCAEAELFDEGRRALSWRYQWLIVNEFLPVLYRISPDGPDLPVFPDLVGFCKIGDRHIDWGLMFDVPGREPAQRAKPFDGQLPRSLVELPQEITGAVDDESYRSLATCDLERGEGTGLPSGESVARLIGARC